MNVPAAIGEIAFPQYLELLDALLPDAEGFVVCDATNTSIAEASTHPVEKGGWYSWAGRRDAVTFGDKEMSRVVAECGRLRYEVSLQSFSGQCWGRLLAVFPDSYTPAAGAERVIVNGLGTVATLLEKEYRLTAELDAMAEELAGRYEELNLVYDNVNELIERSGQGDALNHVVEHCVDHLDVGIVALVFMNRDQVFYAANTAFSDTPYEFVKALERPILEEVARRRTTVIYNEFNDPNRLSLNLETPFKVLASPVLDSKGNVTAALICLNPFDRTDFMNSDRNLLDVMAKRISKIVQANHDELTGLMNHRVLETTLQRAVVTAREQGVFHCFLNVDLHRLRVINDRYGRETGDRIIEQVAVVLSEALRATDSIGYLGEGRYGVLLERCTMNMGLKVADGLRTKIVEMNFEAGGEPLELGVTIGATLIEPHTNDVDDVLEAAEIARDAAKESGQSRVRVFRHDDEDLAARRKEMRWVSEIQSALRENQFRLYCQTIQPSRNTAEQFHFEVLLRLLDDQGAIVSPGLFIPPAEKFNLMHLIDRWVIDATFAAAVGAGLALKSGEGVISINLSGQSLDHRDLVEYIDQCLRQYRIAPDCICFEITETAAVSQLGSAAKLLAQIKAKGCKISLDDFGTGLSSFGYLKELPVDILKIDGSFVKSILDDPVSEAMVNSINEIGHVMQLKTVAEFVETEAIAERLKAIGVDYLQGFGVAKPIPFGDYVRSLGRSD